MRAVAIRVNDVAGVAGFVVAGTHVDVLVSSGVSGSGGGGGGFSLGSRLGVTLPSFNIPTGQTGDNDSAATRTLLQNILVLSAGQEFKRDAEGKPVTVQVVNLLVTPIQAEMLSLAGNQMAMQLVLRNPADTQLAPTRGVTMSNIFSLQDQAPPPSSNAPSLFSPAPSPRTVRTAKAMPEPAPAPVIPRMEIIAGSKRTEVELQLAEAR
jgi:pilus assembly protein CpaB